MNKQWTDDAFEDDPGQTKRRPVKPPTSVERSVRYVLIARPLSLSSCIWGFTAMLSGQDIPQNLVDVIVFSTTLYKLENIQIT